MAQSSKLIPLKCNLDLSANYFDDFTARFIKNLSSYIGANNEIGLHTSGENIAVLKPLQSNEIYAPVGLPDGTNLCISARGFPLVNRVYVWVYNSEGNHLIYRINGSNRTAEIVKVDSLFNFQLAPQYFIGEGQCHLEVNTFVNPDNGEEVTVEDLYWTDGFNYQGYIRVQDCIDTNGFDGETFGYFLGNYDRRTLITMGLPTPKDCINITELPRTEADLGVNDTLLFQGFQFRISVIDVWGRQSEHAIISDLYLPGINDCISSSNSLARCLNLDIIIDNPIIDKVQVEYSNNNQDTWFIDSIVNLYIGSNLGQWWKRARNPDVVFNTETMVMSYTFCRNKECDPIATADTDTLQPGIAKQSQSIGKVGSKIGLANNKYGFNPFSPTLLDKINLTITPPDINVNAFRNITVLVPIYNSGKNNFTSIYKNGAGYAFGSVPDFNHDVSRDGDLLTLFQQRLPNNQTGIIGYLSDGSYAVSTQVFVDSNGDIVDDDTFSGQSAIGLKFLQFVFTAKLPAKYVFRLASHLVDETNLSNYQRTSTTVWGVCPYNNSNYNIQTYDRNSYQELLIDVCDGDYNTTTQNEILVMADLTGSHGSAVTAGELAFNPVSTFQERGANFAVAGYLSENLTATGDMTPIELASMSYIHNNNNNLITDGEFIVGAIQVVQNNAGYSVNSICTDHNGFYWGVTNNGTSLTSTYDSFALTVNNNCVLGSTSRNAGFYGLSVQNIIADNLVNLSGFSCSTCNRIIVKGRIILGSNGGIGIPNVSVFLTRGQSGITDANGDFAIVAHDDINNIIRGNGMRSDLLVIGSSCGYSSSTNGCIDTISITIDNCVAGNCVQLQDCDSPSIGNDLRVVQTDTVTLNYFVLRSLLSGGTYGLSVNGYDYLGRKTFAQLLPYFTIPSITQSKTVGASVLTVTIDPTAIFPDEIAYITFSITAETTIETYLDWIVDNVDFIDATGEINANAPTQIKIYYGSVIEYNILNNYNTTVNWQFIVPNSTSPVVSDKVQFFINSNGQFFDTTVIGLVKYSQDGQFFIIDYDANLANLQPNTYIRLIRPKVCTGNEPTYEICNSKIDIVKPNNTASVNSLVLNAFDTYYLTRAIPVPTQITVPPVPPSTTPTTTTVNELRILGFRFESNSPSNFWGQGVWNQGRLNTKNPYEAEIIKPNEISLSGVLSPNGQISFLQQFDDASKFTFDVPNNGGITTFKNEIGKVAFIAQYDHYVVGYNDNLARINPDGTMQAGSIVDSFGLPQRNNGDTYGCQLVDKLSIASRNGLFHFVDRSRAEVVQYNYSQIVSLTKDENIVVDGVKRGKIDAYFRSKIKSMLSDPTRFFVGSINPVTGEYILTDFSLTTNSYTNQLRTYNPAVSETISFDINTRDVKSWYSFTPEMYAFLDGDALNVQLFSFKQGIPYNHYNLLENNSYNNFYGVQCEPVIKLIIANPPFTKKKWLAISNYCKQSKFFCDEIITESGQQSNIFLDEFDQAYYFSFAAFLRDINTPMDINDSSVTQQNPRIEGNPLYGNWVSARLIGDPANNNNYLEYFGSIIEYFKQEKSG